MAIDGFLALVTASSLPNPPLDFSSIKLDILLKQKSLIAWPDPLHLPYVFDLSKPPDNFREAMACPDADIWHSAMGHEHSSLMERGVFKPAKLPTGRKAIDVCWVYAYKYHLDGSIIKGKEKAHLTAQGFSQQPEDYGTTYAPVAKLTSIRIVLALVTKNDYEILTYNVKTAFYMLFSTASSSASTSLGFLFHQLMTVLLLMYSRSFMLSIAFDNHLMSSMFSYAAFSS